VRVRPALSAVSSAELIAALYFEVLNVDPANPKKADRVCFIISKGHAAVIQYATWRSGAFSAHQPRCTIHALAYRAAEAMCQAARRGDI
jgi:transketolase